MALKFFLKVNVKRTFTFHRLPSMYFTETVIYFFFPSVLGRAALLSRPILPGMCAVTHWLQGQLRCMKWLPKGCPPLQHITLWEREGTENTRNCPWDVQESGEAFVGKAHIMGTWREESVCSRAEPSPHCLLTAVSDPTLQSQHSLYLTQICLNSF